MRILAYLFSSTFFLTVGVVASAEQAYLTAAGDKVSSLDLFRDCDACPEMIVLPMGHFQMGSTVEEAIAANKRSYLHSNVDPKKAEESLRRYYASVDHDPDINPAASLNPFLYEVPRHQVLIDMPVAIGRNEVTREEWAACVAEGGCEQGQQNISPAGYVACERAKECEPTPDARIRFRLPNGPHPTHPRSPMTGITYHEMTNYTSWLNMKIGATVYRIPTEAEWEYAARAGTNTLYAQGDTLSLEQANFLVSRRDLVDGEYVWNYDLGSARKLLPVDDLDAANDWGLRHMSGNASEFTSTCGEGPHRGLATSRQYLAADADQPDCKRSMKGGMYIGNVELTRPARRVAISSDHWSPSIGFRVIRDMTPLK